MSCGTLAGSSSGFPETSSTQNAHRHASRRSRAGISVLEPSSQTSVTQERLSPMISTGRMLEFNPQPPLDAQIGEIQVVCLPKAIHPGIVQLDEEVDTVDSVQRV